MPHEQFQSVKQHQNPSPESFFRRSRVHSHSLHKKRSDPKSDARSWKRLSESKVLSVRLLSGLSTKQQEIKKAMEMQAEAEHRRSDGDPQNKINLARKTTRLRQC